MAEEEDPGVEEELYDTQYENADAAEQEEQEEESIWGPSFSSHSLPALRKAISDSTVSVKLRGAREGSRESSTSN